MSEAPRAPQAAGRLSPRAAVETVGRLAHVAADMTRSRVAFVGAASLLFVETLRWCGRGVLFRTARFRWRAASAQLARVGVLSVPIVGLVQLFIGVILALQLAPTLESYGQLQQIATVIAIAIVRELGPLITAIVLSGYAGASITAEIGAMVEAEEIKALRAHALDPLEFLVVPRFVSTVVAMIGLTCIADVVGIGGGFLTATAVLDVPAATYLDLTQSALRYQDYLTGLFKAGVFGVLVSMIACQEGLSVRGGAVGVGNATTATVVKCIVALIGTDAVFTAVFYAWGI